MSFTEPQKQRKIAQIRALIAEGLTNQAACKKAGLGQATWSRWKKEVSSETPTVVTYNAATTKKRMGRPVGSIKKNQSPQKMAAVVGTAEQIAAFLRGAL